MSGPRLGSLCTGYGGLDMAVRDVLGTELAWTSDVDRGACRIIGHHHPDVPNLGDLTAVDWFSVAPIDVLTAGYPCQPFSHAGRRKGTSDERHLWPHIREAIRDLRPRYTFLENVAGHRSLGFDRVLGDMAEDGMHVRWTSVRASDVGACHRRERLFILITPADARSGGQSWGPSLQGEGRRQAVRGEAGRNPRNSSSSLLPTPRAGDGEKGGPNQRGSSGDLMLPSAVALLPTPGAMNAANDPGSIESWLARRDRELAKHRNGNGFGTPLGIAVRLSWGDYAAAVAGWEHVLGRPAPAPTQTSSKGNPQLAPAFVEWMMGLPEGYVTDPAIWDGMTDTKGKPLSASAVRNLQLKALGNGVVPRQAAEALRWLLSLEQVSAA